MTRWSKREVAFGPAGRIGGEAKREGLAAQKPKGKLLFHSK